MARLTEKLSKQADRVVFLLFCGTDAELLRPTHYPLNGGTVCIPKYLHCELRYTASVSGVVTIDSLQELPNVLSNPTIPSLTP